MKTNKLGIPIVENNYIDGHSIVKYNYSLKVITSYYRMLRSIKTYTVKEYGIHLYKKNTPQCTKQIN